MTMAKTNDIEQLFVKVQFGTTNKTVFKTHTVHHTEVK